MQVAGRKRHVKSSGTPPGLRGGWGIMVFTMHVGKGCFPGPYLSALNFSMIFEDSQGYSKILEDSRRFSRILNESRAFSKILEDSRRFSRILEDSQRFSTIRALPQPQPSPAPAQAKGRVCGICRIPHKSHKPNSCPGWGLGL